MMPHVFHTPQLSVDQQQALCDEGTQRVASGSGGGGGGGGHGADAGTGASDVALLIDALLHITI